MWCYGLYRILQMSVRKPSTQTVPISITETFQNVMVSEAVCFDDRLTLCLFLNRGFMLCVCVCLILGFVYRQLSWVSYHVLLCFSLQKPTVISHSLCCQSHRLMLIPLTLPIEWNKPLLLPIVFRLVKHQSLGMFVSCR